MTDGTKINFNSSGQESYVVDRNSNRTTFTYRSFAATKEERVKGPCLAMAA
jgi:hypothetical protein